MRDILLTFVLACYSSILFSQIHEIGFLAGGTTFIGDIGSTNYIKPNDFGAGLIYKYNLNPRIALRGNYTYMRITGDDSKSGNAFRAQRGFSFSNNIHEFAIGMEFNFHDYQIREIDHTFTPYILAQAAVFSYKKPNAVNANNELNFKNGFSYTLPVGLGIKGRLNDYFAYAIEAGVRFALVDDIDYTTAEIGNQNLNLNFGGNGNDNYVFTGISIVYCFGRPSCFTPED